MGRTVVVAGVVGVGLVEMWLMCVGFTDKGRGGLARVGITMVRLAEIEELVVVRLLVVVV